ncbi:TIGR04104 family putative zinc finger protein [Bacillus daqingensis]|uniref:TIGR04104 family putative zinc finger protein n=1 Tax=Bacillus daqingensis TaxID=872396 RepID=A0ABV9NXR0_9BACI
MKRPTCEACHQTLSWKQALKAQRLLYEYTNCPHCNETQYITTHGKVVFWIAILPTTPLMLNFFFDLAIGTSIALFFLIALIALGITPYAYTLTNEDKRAIVRES